MVQAKSLDSANFFFRERSEDSCMAGRFIQRFLHGWKILLGDLEYHCAIKVSSVAVLKFYAPCVQMLLTLVQVEESSDQAESAKFLKSPRRIFRQSRGNLTTISRESSDYEGIFRPFTKKRIAWLYFYYENERWEYWGRVLGSYPRAHNVVIRLALTLHLKMQNSTAQGGSSS